MRNIIDFIELCKSLVRAIFYTALTITLAIILAIVCFVVFISYNIIEAAKFIYPAIKAIGNILLNLFYVVFSIAFIIGYLYLVYSIGLQAIETYNNNWMSFTISCLGILLCIVLGVIIYIAFMIDLNEEIDDIFE